MTTAKVSVQASDGSRTVTLSSYSATCVPSIYYKLDGGETKALGKNPGTIVIAKVGTTKVEYWAIDLTGNRETTHALNVEVLGLGPKVTTDGAASYEGTATVNLAVSDPTSQVNVFQVQLDSEPTQTVSGSSVAITTAAPGVHVLKYYAVNALGRSVSGQLSFAVTPVVPRVSLAVNPRVTTYPAIVTLTAIARNIEATAATFQVHYESEPEGKWTTVGTVSSTTGLFVLLQIPPKRAYYKVLVGSVESTPVLDVRVSAGMSKPKTASPKVKAGRLTRFWGTIRPQHPAVDPPAADTTYKVRFWKWNPWTKKWVETGTVPWKIEKVLSNDESQWSYSRRFSATQAGSWRVAFYHSCPRHAAKISPVLQFTVVK